MFAYLNPNLEHIVFGVDTAEQLKEDLEIVANPSENSTAFMHPDYLNPPQTKSSSRL